MDVTRRQLGKLAMAAPAAAMLASTDVIAAPAQAKPNSLFNGVQIGTITYSYGSMPDQSAEATLKYIVASGISAVELMGGPIESYLGAPGRGGGRGGRAGAAGAPDGRAAGGGAAGDARGGGAPAGGGRGPGFGALGRGAADPATLTSSYNGQPCAPAFDAGGQNNRGGGAGGRGGRGAQTQTPEQIAQAQQAAEERRKWMQSISLDKVRALRKMYNDAGVSIYAAKFINANMSDDELDTYFTIASTLGATHTTLELLDDEAQLKRLGDFGLKHKVYVAYHTHTQGTMTAFDKALAVSRGNMSNVDLGHFVAGGGDPIAFLTKFHDRIASFHMKDRTTPAHCALNLAWGTGETPIKEILQTVKKNRWTMPATIELEYQIPAGSDAPSEVKKCVEYCRQALA